MHRFHQNYLNTCFLDGDLKTKSGLKRKTEKLFEEENNSLFTPKKRRKLVQTGIITDCDRIRLKELAKCVIEGKSIHGNDQQLLLMKHIVGDYAPLKEEVEIKRLKKESSEKQMRKDQFLDEKEREQIDIDVESARKGIMKAQRAVARELRKYKTKKIRKEVVVGDLRSWVTPLVMPAKVVSKGPYKLVFLSKKHVTRLDVLNTLSHIESCTRKLSSVRVDADSNKDNIILQLLPEDLNLIQIGWTTQLMCYPKTRRHLSVPNFPWIIRCLLDSDPDVYLQGLQCFVKLFVYLHSYERYDEKVIETVRKLPQLLHKFGKERGKYVWEAKFFESSKEEKSAFLIALQTFLLPPLNYLTDCMYINTNGLAILKDQLGQSSVKMNANETALWTFVKEAERHRCTKKRNWFKFTLSKQELYSPFYNYILSESIDSNVALRLFFSVSNWRNIKKNSVQMPKSIYRRNMGAVDQQYFNIPCGEKVSFHQPEIQMMRMIQFLELNSTQDIEDSSVGYMINDRVNGGCGSYLFTTAFNLREKFIPFAQLPRGFPKSLPATEVFPIHKFNFEAIKTNKSDTGEKVEVIKMSKKAKKKIIQKEKVFDNEILKTVEGSIRQLKKLSTEIKTKYDGKIHYN